MIKKNTMKNPWALWVVDRMNLQLFTFFFLVWALRIKQWNEIERKKLENLNFEQKIKIRITKFIDGMLRYVPSSKHLKCSEMQRMKWEKNELALNRMMFQFCGLILANLWSKVETFNSLNWIRCNVHNIIIYNFWCAN